MLQRLAVMPSMFGVDSPLSVGVQLAAVATAAPASGAPGFTNQTIYVPLTVTETITIVKGWWVNGATSNGNVDIGLYPEAGGTKIVSLGSTAQGTINVLQEGNIADTVVPPGRYLMAFGWSSATATFFSYSATYTTNRQWKALGIAKEAAFALPASATPAVWDSATTGTLLPVFGFSQRTLVA